MPDISLMPPLCIAPDGGSTVWRVRIEYREPDYEERFGRKEKPYRFSYRVRANNADCATSAALAQFKEDARDSNVGWYREVVRVCALGEVAA